MIHVDAVLGTAIAAVYDDEVPFPEKHTNVARDLHSIEITHVRICVDPYIVAAPPGLLGHARHIDLAAAWVWGIAVDDEEEANACLVHGCLTINQHKHVGLFFKSIFRVNRFTMAKRVPLSLSPSEWLDFEARTTAYAERNHAALRDVFKPEEGTDTAGHGKCSFANSSLEFLERGLKSLASDMEDSELGPLRIMNVSRHSRFIPFTGVLNLTALRYRKPERTLFAMIDLLESSFAGSVVGAYALIPPRHAVAVLAWADPFGRDTFHFGIYDPQGAAGYIFTGERRFTFENKYEYDGRQVRVQTHQLSENCPQFQKGYRCPQFYYDYQYCHMYAIQFLFHVAALLEQDPSIHVADATRQAVLNSLLIKSQAQLEQIGRNNTKASIVYNVVIVNIMCLFVVVYDHILKQKGERLSLFKCGVQLIADVVDVQNGPNGPNEPNEPNESGGTLPIYDFITRSSKDCKDRLGAVISYCRRLPKDVRDKMLPLFELSPSPSSGVSASVRQPQAQVQALAQPQAQVQALAQPQAQAQAQAQSPPQARQQVQSRVHVPLHNLDKILTQRLLRSRSSASSSASKASLRTASLNTDSQSMSQSSPRSISINSSPGRPENSKSPKKK